MSVQQPVQSQPMRVSVWHVKLVESKSPHVEVPQGDEHVIGGGEVGGCGELGGSGGAAGGGAAGTQQPVQSHSGMMAIASHVSSVYREAQVSDKHVL